MFVPYEDSLNLQEGVQNIKVSSHHGLFVLQWNHKGKKKGDAGGVGVGQHIVQAMRLSSLSLHQGTIKLDKMMHWQT